MITLVVDGNYLLHRCCRIKELAQLTNRHGKPTGGFVGTLKSLQGLLSRFKADRCIFVMDGGISKYRRSLYPEYKGAKHRDPKDPKYKRPDDETLEYYKSFKIQGRCLKEILPHLGVSFLQLPTWEGDDLVYFVSREFCPPGLVYMVSDDQDYFQAVGKQGFGHQTKHIYLYRPIHKQLITEDSFVLDTGHPKEQHLLRRTIIGDGSDNIAGVYGMGAKGLDSLFLKYTGEVVYPFEEFFLHCADHKLKKVRNIADNMDVVLRNYEIMAFDMMPFPDELYGRVRKKLDEPVSVDIHRVKVFLTELDAFQLTNKLHRWVLPFQGLMQ